MSKSCIFLLKVQVYYSKLKHTFSSYNKNIKCQFSLDLHCQLLLISIEFNTFFSVRAASP